jgi:hopanoid C-2 methylase
MPPSISFPVAPSLSPRKRVLVVNCYVDYSREPIRRPTKFPQAVGPIFLAGAFSRDRCEVRCYDELASGPLENESLLGWPDMLVLTGLTHCFDRMLHLTAYARTKNPKVIVVAGGPAVRALPLLSERFFNYSCLGDIEELREVITEAWGDSYAAGQMLPRFDLAYWIKFASHVESTRYCNFHCSFCSLTGEGRSYQTYDLENIRQQILGAGKRRKLLFVDNNFYGNDREHFHRRIELLKELRAAGQFRNWAALVTNDFFNKQENLTLAKESGCELLFSGVESFDSVWLRSFNKLQNTSLPQVEMISRCLNSGIIFCYGLMLDLTTRTIADVRRELEFITGTPEISLPAFITLSIPILGTPYFYECLNDRTILPETKLRDMDGITIVQKTLDPMDEVVQFVRDVEQFRGLRGRILKHTMRFFQLYRSKLNPLQIAIGLEQGLLLSAHTLMTSSTGLGWLKQRRRRTFVSTTEPVDQLYTPAFRVDARLRNHFQPTMVTDKSGNLTAELVSSGLLKHRPAPAQIDRRAVAIA